jgi:hypothetical protein
MRDNIFKKILNNKKLNKWMISGIIVFVILVSVTVVAFAIKRNAAEKDVCLDTQSESLEDSLEDTQEVESSEDTQEDTTQEDTTDATPVSDDVINQYFADNVNTDDEDPLPGYEDIESRPVIPYDGVSRAISCWGDSMTYGMNVNSNESYPAVLQSLVGKTVYNLGVPGETSIQIASRQGAFPMYTDQDIIVKPDESTDVKFISSYTQQPMDFYTDNSGYTIRSRPNNDVNDLCFFNQTPVCAKEEDNQEMGVKLCPDNNGILSQIAISECSRLASVCISSDTEINQKTNNSILLSNEIQVSSKMTQELITQELTTQAPTTQESTTQQPTTQQPTTQQPTTQQPTTQQPTTQQPTAQQPTTQQPTTQQPTTQIEQKPISFPAGTPVYTRAALERRGDILVLEIGSNGGWQSNYQEIVDQYSAMIDSANCKYYIIVGDTDDPGTSGGDTLQDTPYDSDGNYIGIGDTAWEATLRKVFGDHFINMRVELIQHGLDYAGMSTTQQDLDDFQCGFISKRLRSDWTHLNKQGYYAKARLIYEKGASLGYWN